MPEPISAAIAFAGLSLLDMHRKSTSVSESGSFLRDESYQFKLYTRQPVSLNPQRHQALAELDQLVSECDRDAWDGERAPAVSQLTVRNVEAFLLSLPHDIPDPEFAPDPDDGSISLEWHGGYRKVASVSVNPSDRLAFASLHGTDISRGAYRFSEDRIPEIITSSIRNIIR